MSIKHLASKVGDKFMHGKGIFTFLRSSVSSQIASWTDMGVCFIFYAWVFHAMGTHPLRSFISTAIGLVCGGIVNCIVNYKFTFQVRGINVKAVAVKYLIIWAGSFILNLGGTTLLEQAIHHMPFIERSHWIRPDGVYAFARLSVSLVVSLAWNFLLQKNFVYKVTKFDPVAIRLVDAITFHRKKSAATAPSPAAPETEAPDSSQNQNNVSSK